MSTVENGFSAAAERWQVVHREGASTCSRCQKRRPPADVIVLYRVALSCGGSDIPSNVRVLCRWCASRR